MKRRNLAILLAAAMLMGAGSVSVNASESTTEAVTAENHTAEPEALLGDLPSEPAVEPEEENTSGSVEEEVKKPAASGGATLDTVKGLIEGADLPTISKDYSNGFSWEDIEEEAPEATTLTGVKIPGFTVDPSKYPAANITVNTQRLYWYLVDEMQLSHAAACGVLANVQLESNFRPLAIGDSGTSFGICQWHLGRLSALMSYCNANALDYHTIDGQMAYLQYELNGGYAGVLAGLREVEDSPEGAYEAGYLFCTGFEKPDQTILRAQRRGNLAQNEYYGRTFDAVDPEAEAQEAAEILRAIRERVKEKAQRLTPGDVIEE